MPYESSTFKPRKRGYPVQGYIPGEYTEQLEARLKKMNITRNAFVNMAVIALLDKLEREDQKSGKTAPKKASKKK